MVKEDLHKLIDMTDENELETIYKILLKFVAEDKPLPDEIEAIETARKEIATNNLIPHDKVY